MAINHGLIQLRARTSSEWLASDPIPPFGRVVAADLGSTTPILKMGDGVRHWSELPSIVGGGAGGGSDYVAGTVVTLPPGSPAQVVIDNSVDPPTISFGIPRGDVGAPGPANSLAVGTVTTGAAGSAATVTISGAPPNQILDMTIPRGDAGAAGPPNSLAIGTVTTGAPGSSAGAVITGTPPSQTLSLTIPRGDVGAPGTPGAPGPANALSIGTVTTGAPGSAASATITGTPPTQTLNLTIPRGDVGATPALADASASVGLTAKAGVAPTAMRSDSAPALDVTIAPTWSGAHTFSLTPTVPDASWSFAKLAQGAALSVLGVTGNAAAAMVSITAGTDGFVLRRSGTSLGFGTVATAGLANGAVTYAKIQNVSASDTILGRVTAGAGVIEEIICTAAGRALLDDANAAAQLTTLGAAPSARLISTQYSITGGGDLSANRTLNLVGDVAAPGNSMMYGTDGTGVRGWYAQPAIAFGTPSAKIGLAAVAGISPTAMRSDAAPSLDVTIAPTWSGAHTFSLTPVVPNASWTYAKIQNVSATSRVLGRITVGAGAIEELTSADLKTILALTAADIGSGAALTKVDDTNVTLTLGGTPASALLKAASITAGWTGQLSVARGGTGAATLTGYVKGTGTTAFTASATIPYSDLTGTPTIPTSANPSTAIGLAAINGSASTFMRSDAAPALDQAIAPTWTAQHKFTSAGGNGAIILESSAPYLRWNETDQAADLKSWLMGPSNTLFVLGATTDAGNSVGTTGIRMTRTTAGSGINEVQLIPGTAVTVGNFTPVAVSGTTVVFQNVGTGVSTGTNLCLRCNTGNPGGAVWLGRGMTTTLGDVTAITAGNELGAIRFFAADGTAFSNSLYITAKADEAWTTSAHGSYMEFTAVKNGGTVVSTALSLRATAITLGNTADNPTFTFNGTGLATFNGSVRLNSTLSIAGSTGTAGQYLRSAGASAPTWGTIAYSEINGTPSIPGPAAPTATAGRTAVAGVATTYMRSDAAPALDLTALVNSTQAGFAPASGGGTVNFLRADGSWAVPPGAGVTPQALTKVDDTNVTLTLSANAPTALLNATSITAGWTGTLAAARGGTGLGSYAVGDLLYASTTSALSKLAAGTAGQVLTANGAGVAPSWQAVTATVNQAANYSWTGAHSFLGLPGRGGATANASIGLSNGTTPTISLVHASAGTDKKSVEFVMDAAGEFYAQFVNQAVNVGREFLRVTRGTTGPAVSSMLFGNPADNPAYTFQGNGATTFGGSVGIVHATNVSLLTSRCNQATMYASVRCINDVGRTLEIDYAGSAYSGGIMTGAPSGEGAGIVTTAAFPLTFGTANIARMWIDGAGAVNIVGSCTAASFNVSSSRALKRETGRPSRVRDVLARLRPVFYRMLAGDDREQIGLIAEEVNEVCPQLSDGKAVAYDRLALLLLADWQEAHANG